MPVTINGTSGLSGVDGSAGTPAVQGSDTNTGVYFPAADTISASTGGTERMRIDSSGNVGIGTTSPSSYLTRCASVAPSDYGASFVAVSNSSAANWARIDLKNVNVATNTYWYKDQFGLMGLINEGAHAMVFGTNNTERMRIDSSGNVGIGTATPSLYDAKLAVFNGNIALTTTTAKLYLYYFSATNLAHVSTATDGSITFTNGTTSPTERMRIDYNGNVGIGTTSPSVKLDLLSSLSNIPVMKLRNTNAGGYTGAQLLDESGNLAAHWGYGGSTTSLSNRMYVGTIAAQPLVLTTSDTERMRIDSSGNVGIGTNPANATLSGYSGKLTIDGTGTYFNQSNNYRSPASFSTAGVVTNLAIPLYAGGGSVRAICVAYNSDTLEFARASNASATGGVTIDMVINGSGNVGIGTSTFGTSAATVLAIATGTAPSTGPADTIQIFSTDLSAGNTILSLRTEGTPVNANTTAAATHRIAVRINGTVYYLLANTAA